MTEPESRDHIIPPTPQPERESLADQKARVAGWAARMKTDQVAATAGIRAALEAAPPASEPDSSDDDGGFDMDRLFVDSASIKAGIDASAEAKVKAEESQRAEAELHASGRASSAAEAAEDAGRVSDAG